MQLERTLFCKSLQTRTTAEHVSQLLSASVQENWLDWKRCTGVYMDGAKAMTGRHSGVS